MVGILGCTILSSVSSSSERKPMTATSWSKVHEELPARYRYSFPNHATSVVSVGCPAISGALSQDFPGCGLSGCNCASPHTTTCPRHYWDYLDFLNLNRLNPFPSLTSWGTQVEEPQASAMDAWTSGGRFCGGVDTRSVCCNKGSLKGAL